MELDAALAPLISRFFTLRLDRPENAHLLLQLDLTYTNIVECYQAEQGEIAKRERDKRNQRELLKRQGLA